jgi:3-oxoacyl-[acyl-carrier protein] reductase
LIDRLLDSNYEVFATYRRNPSVLSEKFERVGLDPSERVIQADLAVYEDVHQAIDAVSVKGPLWGVINMAGQSSAQRLTRMAAEDVCGTFLNNSLPAIYLTKASLEAFKAHGLGGRLVHLSSVTVRRPVPGVIPYVAGKSAVEGMTRSAAEEAGRYGCTINVLRLGYFGAGMGSEVPREILDQVLASTASRRLGEIDDLSAAVRHLLSADGEFINGTVIDLDGGLL